LVSEFSVTAVKCVLEGTSGAGEDSVIPFGRDSSFGFSRSNMDGIARVGNALVGLSGS